MYELIPCPRCRGGKVHYYIGVDIWNDCPTCGGSGFVRKGVVINNDYSKRLAKTTDGRGWSMALRSPSQ